MHPHRIPAAYRLFLGTLEQHQTNSASGARSDRHYGTNLLFGCIVVALKDSSTQELQQKPSCCVDCNDQKGGSDETGHWLVVCGIDSLALFVRRHGRFLTYRSYRVSWFSNN